MRSFLIPAAALALLAGSPAAQAAVAIDINKNLQQMTVSVDGVPRYTWPVSSGNPSHETPNGNFRTFRMEEDHYSKEFDDAPMPHSIFFTKQGHAIHGTDSVSRLGTPASHGCVRLSRANATTLWNLVKSEGLLNTTVKLTGSSLAALARNPKPRTNVARGDAEQPMTIAPENDPYQSSTDQDRIYQNRARQPYYGNPTYGNSASADDPRWPAQPQQRRLYPDPRGGGYIQESNDPYPGFQRQSYPDQPYLPRGRYSIYE